MISDQFTFESGNKKRIKNDQIKPAICQSCTHRLPLSNENNRKNEFQDCSISKNYTLESHESNLNTLSSDNKDKKVKNKQIKTKKNYLNVFQTDTCLLFKVSKRRYSHIVNSKQSVFDLSDYTSMKNVIKEN